VLSGLRHRIRAVELLHPGVHETPAERRVFERNPAGEGGVSLVHHEKGARPFFTPNGARDILSPPPAMTRSISPAAIARAAVATASMLDPQSRFTVDPGTLSGSPASSSAIRPT